MSAPVFQSLLDELRGKIADSEASGGTFIGTELDMGRRHKLSRVSVRTAVGRLVEEGLLERRPGRGVFARRPSHALRMLDIIVPNIEGMWRDIIAGAQRVEHADFTQVRICNARGVLEADVRMVQRLPDSETHGAIVGSFHQQPLREAIARIYLGDFPVVLVDESLDGIDVPSVIFDDRTAGRLIAEHLLQMGHRRIGFVGYTGTRHLDQRLYGLRDTLNDAGVAMESALVGTTAMPTAYANPRAAVVSQLKPMLERSERPTAVVLHDSLMAFSAYDVAHGMGLKIPRDLSVVGFGHALELGGLTPALTCAALPAQEMGRVAMDVLLGRMASPSAPAEHHVLPVGWHEGESVGKRRAGRQGGER